MIRFVSCIFFFYTTYAYIYICYLVQSKDRHLSSSSKIGQSPTRSFWRTAKVSITCLFFFFFFFILNTFSFFFFFFSNKKRSRVYLVYPFYVCLKRKKWRECFCMDNLSIFTINDFLFNKSFLNQYPFFLFLILPLRRRYYWRMTFETLFY